MAGDLDYRIGVRLNKQEYDYLSRIATKMECTLSQAVRLILSEAVVITNTVNVPVTTNRISIPTFVEMARTEPQSLVDR